MKKTIYLFTILVLIISLVACGAKKPSPVTNNPAVINPPDNKITYTKEIPYMPSYAGMKSTEFNPATTKEPLAKAIYAIKNTTDVKVFEDYEAILKKEGWTITKEQKAASFSAKKDTRIANISISTLTTNKDVLLTIQTK